MDPSSPAKPLLRETGKYLVEHVVDRARRAIGVVRVVVAQDMGVVVNPAGALQQLEGCVMMGLGYVLSEEVQFRNGEVLDKNFSSYELPHFSWAPKIEGLLLESPDLPAQGGGEPAIINMGRQWPTRCSMPRECASRSCR